MPRPRSEKARTAVLAATRGLLEADGYDAMSIEGIAAVAEVSKQTIYRWWASKAAIVGEALLDGPNPTLDSALPITDDLAHDLRTWLRMSAEQLASPRSAALTRALIAVTATDPDLGPALTARFAAPVMTAIVARLEAARADGDLDADVDARAVAELFLSLSAFSALTGRPLEDERIDAIVRVLCCGILPAEISR